MVEVTAGVCILGSVAAVGTTTEERPVAAGPEVSCLPLDPPDCVLAEFTLCKYTWNAVDRNLSCASHVDDRLLCHVGDPTHI